MDIACDAIIMYADRHADELEKMAAKRKESSGRMNW